MSIQLGVVVDDRWVRAKSGTYDQQLEEFIMSALTLTDEHWVRAESGKSEKQLEDIISRAFPLADNDKRIVMIEWTNDDNDTTGIHWHSYYFTSTSTSVPRLDCSYLSNGLLHI